MLREPTTLAKEKLFCVACSYSHQTIGLLLLSPLPTRPPQMDNTLSHPTCTRDGDGPCTWEIGTDCRKCPPTATTPSPSTPNQTTTLHENRSTPAGASGKGRAGMYVAYFNRARPHQGIHQQIPEPDESSVSFDHEKEKVIAVPILGGLHHDYQRGA